MYNYPPSILCLFFAFFQLILILPVFNYHQKDTFSGMILTFFCDGMSARGSSSCVTTRPLWNRGSCTNCASSDNSPWFYRQLQNTATDDIEMRVCRDEAGDNEDVAIEAFEFYIQ